MTHKPKSHYTLSALAAVAVVLCGSSVHALTITTTTDATALAQTMLGGPGITITNAVLSGGATAAGFYVDGPLYLPDGIVLSSGSVEDLLPPNVSTSTTTAFGLPGDPLCDAITGTNDSEDAVKLTVTFDLALGYDGIEFRSLSGSEEYPEYVNSAFNDVVAVFLNGVNVELDNLGDAILINGAFYQSDAVVEDNGTELDGSTPLLFGQAPLTGGTTGNTLTVVVCDTADDALDTALFLSSLAGCTGDCSQQTTWCGDGVIQPATEECDDGNNDPADACDNTCLINCTLPSDCASGVCTNGKCAIATCSDDVQNQDEVDVDCGGAVCPPCIDTDGDGIFDPTDPDDDNDGVSDGFDDDPLNPNDCQDLDSDGCDDCAIGVDGFGALPDNTPDNDGTDTDDDGQCDLGDDDDDGDTVLDVDDTDPLDAFVCQDLDNDGCDDCSVSGGPPSTSNDGTDTDGDGLCDGGDPDTDNDGVADAADTDPFDPDVCADADDDGCDDCSVGTDDFGPLADNVPDDDGTDTDGDGLCDSGELDNGTDPDDADSDDDGALDGDEPDWNQDTDGDGLINALDVDSDNDGLYDGTELGLDCSDPDTELAANHCVPDADAGATTTDPLDADTDDGGVNDGSEDSDLDGEQTGSETDPTAGHGGDDVVNDSDGDGLSDETELTMGTDPNDADSDDDGVLDGDEANPADDHDGDGLINALDPDSDDDGLWDGTEVGNDCDHDDTDSNAGQCIPDADGGQTTTSMVDWDTDGGGVSDGAEDTNGDGAVDGGEFDPNDPLDDHPCTQDSDCGAIDSGTVCDDDSQFCRPGCRGTGGNGCPQDLVCTSMDNTIGECIPAGGGGGAGGGGSGPGGAGGGASGPGGGGGGASGPVGGGGGTLPGADPLGETFAQGGCACRAAGHGGTPAGALALLLGAVVLGGLRRRRRAA